MSWLSGKRIELVMEHPLHKVVMIIPYFGHWPEWFQLYLYSCSKAKIDFWYFTDCELPEVIYPNTFFYQISFDDYCSKVSEALGIDFKPENAYKLCDLKPFLGIVHHDLVCGYDYWAFGDLDMLWGNSDIIVGADRLKKYDLISTHSDRISGHFTAVRTKSRFTNKCFDIKDWEMKLTDQSHRNVDEGDYTLAVFPQIKWLYRLYRVYNKFGGALCMNSFLNKVNVFFCNRFSCRSFYEFDTTPEPMDCEEWIYDIGGVITAPSGRKLPYLHFLFFKKNKYKTMAHQWDDGVFLNRELSEIINQGGAICISNRGLRALSQEN